MEPLLELEVSRNEGKRLLDIVESDLVGGTAAQDLLCEEALE